MPVGVWDGVFMALWYLTIDSDEVYFSWDNHEPIEFGTGTFGDAYLRRTEACRDHVLSTVRMLKVHPGLVSDRNPEFIFTVGGHLMTPWDQAETGSDVQTIGRWLDMVHDPITWKLLRAYVRGIIISAGRIHDFEEIFLQQWFPFTRCGEDRGVGHLVWVPEREGQDVRPERMRRMAANERLTRKNGRTSRNGLKSHASKGKGIWSLILCRQRESCNIICSKHTWSVSGYGDPEGDWQRTREEHSIGCLEDSEKLVKSGDGHHNVAETGLEWEGNAGGDPITVVSRTKLI